MQIVFIQAKFSYTQAAFRVFILDIGPFRFPFQLTKMLSCLFKPESRDTQLRLD